MNKDDAVMYKFEVMFKDVDGVESWYSFPERAVKTPELALARGKTAYPGLKVRVVQVRQDDA